MTQTPIIRLVRSLVPSREPAAPARSPITPKTPASLLTVCYARKGFTLIELMVVVVILATLVGLGAIGVAKTLKGAESTKRDAYAKTVGSAIMAYKNENGSYPIDASGGSSASVTYGSVSSNRPKQGNAEVMLLLYGRDSNGKRNASKRAYLTDSSMLYVCKGGRRISKLDETLANGSLSADDMIGFQITMNKSGASAYKELSQAKAFAPVKITIDFDLDHYTVSIPGEGEFNQVIKLK